MDTNSPLTQNSLSFSQTFAALKHYNYRLWFSGQVVSLTGTWMQSTAQGFLVYELTKSPAYLGYVGFASGLPSWLFTLYGGVIADRIPRRTMLIITQTTMMFLAFILAGLVFTNLIQPWQIVLLAFLLGVANAFDAPARVSFVAELVPRQDMSNAIALNSTMFNTGTVIGPAIAGLAYAWLGPGWCFTFNGISFLAVIAALVMMKIQLSGSPVQHGSARDELKEGFQYVLKSQVIRTLTLNMGILSLFGLSMMTLVPAWSVDILHGDVTTNGLLLSARGAGALVGALMIAAISHMGFRGKIWTVGSFATPIFMILFAITGWLPLALVLLFGTGWSFMTQANTSNALVQSEVPDQLRGRVMSIYTMIFFGGMPIGSLLIGQVAAQISEPPAVIFSALVLFALASFIWLRFSFIRKLE